MSRLSFDQKGPSETTNVAFDFTSSMAAAETISTSTVAASTYSGTDANPSLIINGSASSSGQVVTQSLTAGTAGVTYLLTCTITTSAGQVLQLSGFLTVTEAQFV